MGAITSTVFRRDAPCFNMVGQKLPDHFQDTDEQISAGLVRRLYRYALRKLVSSGFNVSEWSCEVYAMDQDLPPSERYYIVEFSNDMGGMIGVQGILTLKGHPHINHGICCDWGRP